MSNRTHRSIFTLGWMALCFLPWLFLVGCTGGGKQETLRIHSRSLKKEKAAFHGVPDEIASLGSGSLGHNYWVEGTVQNTGPTDVRNVVIVFHCMDGTERRKLMADLPLVGANEIVPFRTRVLPTTRTLVLLEREPGIKFE